MADASEQVEILARQAGEELRGVKDLKELETFRIKYLGTKGLIKDSMKLLGTAPPEQKPALGQQINAMKQGLTAEFEAKKTQLAAGGTATCSAMDVTEPGNRPAIGNRHILRKVVDELTDLFGRMGDEEFASLLPDTTRQDAVWLAERLRSRVRSHLPHGRRATDYRDSQRWRRNLGRCEF